MGIATKFLKMIEEKYNPCKNIKSISLHVITYNISGQKFYKKCGFILCQTCPNHYTINSENFDALFFCKFLNGAKKVRSFSDMFKMMNPFAYLPKMEFCKRKRKSKLIDFWFLIFVYFLTGIFIDFFL